jgi:hypothetical protein
VRRIAAPVLLVLVALVSAAGLGWGTHPDWARYERGLDWIMTARRLQWPLATLSILACVTLVAMVVVGMRRAGWLLVLAPVVLLFHQRFAAGEFRRMGVVDQARFVGGAEASFLKDDSPVVGLEFEGVAYAYAFGSLYRSPVVAHSDSDKRVMLMWNPYASRAVAWAIDHTIKLREVDIVSMPANAMLLYNARIGQFINGFTGLTPEGERPSGFLSPVQTHKTTWGQWRAAHPQTRVMAARAWPEGEKPEQRYAHRPLKTQTSPRARVSLVSTARPVAVLGADAGNGPFNLTAGGCNLLLIRDKAGRLRAFDRALKGDLFPTFRKRTIAREPDVAMFDSDTQSLWNMDGRCVDGYAKGEHLRPIPIEDELPLGVLASYYPDLEVISLR